MPLVSPRHPLRILLVDDSSHFVSAVGDGLRMDGHVVFVAASGSDALRQFSPARFDVVITDFAMPAQNGLELARALRERWPEQRIVMLSGYTEALPVGEKPQDVDVVLRKPISLEALGATVAILGAPDFLIRRPGPAEAGESVALPS